MYWSVLTICLGLFLASLSACSSKSEQRPNSARYVKAVYSEPLTLDPAQMHDTASLVASNLVYDGPLSFTTNLELKGALAES